MTSEKLSEKLFELVSAVADRVVADPRWENEKDDLGVSVFGMVLYGYALINGRIVLFLDMEDIETALVRCLVERVGVAPKWAGGLVADAAHSAFDQAYHPTQHELVGIGHRYIGLEKLGELVDRVFASIQYLRQ